MSNVATIRTAQRDPDEQQPRAVRQRMATVLGVRDGRYVIERDELNGALAERATSCLVEPRAGDTVLLSESDEGCFVLAVLRRGETEGPVTLSADGADLQLSGRSVGIAAQEDIEVVSGAALRMVTGHLSLRAVEAEAVVDRGTFVGKLLRTHASKVELIADAVDTLAERVVQRAERVYRTVAQLDQLRAGQVDYRAEGLMGLRAKHTVMTARDVVKVDGSQIHVG